MMLQVLILLPFRAMNLSFRCVVLVLFYVTCLCLLFRCGWLSLMLGVLVLRLGLIALSLGLLVLLCCFVICIGCLILLPVRLLFVNFGSVACLDCLCWFYFVMLCWWFGLLWLWMEWLFVWVHALVICFTGCWVLFAVGALYCWLLTFCVVYIVVYDWLRVWQFVSLHLAWLLGLFVVVVVWFVICWLL